jgi:hypothetical protein
VFPPFSHPEGDRGGWYLRAPARDDVESERGEITPFRVVGGPTNGLVRMDTQRADTEVRAPATLNLEYGAVRRFSFLRPGRGCVERDVQPEKSVFVVGWWTSFVCGDGARRLGSFAPHPKRWPHRTLNRRADRRCSFLRPV